MPDAAPSRSPAPPAPLPRDLLSGPINRTLLLFALPTLASNILQSLNGSINAIWVGRFLGPGALAATSNANLVMFLMFSALFGFGMAATILVGQNLGRGDVVSARRAMGSALGLFMLVAVGIAIAGWFATPALLRLLATPAEAQPPALAYLRVIFLVMPASFLMVMLMMGLRGFGDSWTPLWFMLLSALLDGGLNPVLILGLGPAPRLGIAGSALATLIATYVSCAAMVATIYWRDLPIRLRGSEWRFLKPERALIRVIAAKGLPMGLQMIVMSVSALMMIGLVNRYGVVTTAAYGAINQLWAYVQMPAMAIGAAVSAMAAQNIGAGRWDRVDRITRSGVAANLAMTGALVVAIALIDRQAIGLFLGPDNPGIATAAHIHLVAGWSFALFGISIVLTSTMRANGVVLAPLAILIVAVFPVRLGFALTLLPGWGPDAIWWGFPAGSLATLLMSGLYYRFGGWRKVSLLAAVDRAEATVSSPADGEACGKLQPAA